MLALIFFTFHQKHIMFHSSPAILMDQGSCKSWYVFQFPSNALHSQMVISFTPFTIEEKDKVFHQTVPILNKVQDDVIALLDMLSKTVWQSRMIRKALTYELAQSAGSFGQK